MTLVYVNENAHANTSLRSELSRKNIALLKFKYLNLQTVVQVV